MIELTTRMRARHDISPGDIAGITVEMNWLETTYPSPAFPNPDRNMPGVGSTHYFTAYTWVHGSYPPLRQRLDPGQGATEADRAVTELQQRVEVLGQRNRGGFAPRITVRTHSGEEFSDEMLGNELEWDLATETKRISALFPDLPWPASQLDSLVAAVNDIEHQPDIGGLIAACVPS